MGTNSIVVEPGDIALLGDDIIEHLRHFSNVERHAIALYVGADASAEMSPTDAAAALNLVRRAILVGRAAAV